MEKINVTLNGQPVSGEKGTTILQLAKDNGIDIPTLCYLEGLSPTGSCRMCVVEVKNSRTLVASCRRYL
jgi:NADH dehydrogenase/NADH:ubiquinone oxidoreductase subunit G